MAYRLIMNLTVALLFIVFQAVINAVPLETPFDTRYGTIDV